MVSYLMIAPLIFIVTVIHYDSVVAGAQTHLIETNAYLTHITHNAGLVFVIICSLG